MLKAGRIRTIILCTSFVLGFIQESKAYDKLLNNTSWKGAWQIHHPPRSQFWWHTIGDTVLNGKSYVVIKHTDTSVGFNIRSPKVRYLREDTIARKVFLLDTNLITEKLMYDFGLNIGDSVIPAREINYANPTYETLRRIDTASTLWGVRRRLHFDSINANNYNVLIEGAGWNNYGPSSGNSGDDIFAFTFFHTLLYPQQWIGCIYQNRIQKWFFYGNQNFSPCESMCPSIGITDSTTSQKNPICLGDSVLLEGSCDTSQYWTTLANPSIILSTASDIYESPLIPTTYLRHGSMKTDTIKILIQYPINVSLGPDTSSCANNPYTLIPITSDTNFTFYWSDLSRDSTMTIDSSGTYWVRLRDRNWCFMIYDTMIYTAFDIPIVTIDSFRTSKVNDSPFPLTSGFPSGGTYHGNGVNNGIFNPSVAGIGMHILNYVFIDSNSCSDTASMIMEVESTIGVSEIYNHDAIRMFPNPNHGAFKVISQEDGQLEIYSTSGKMVFSQSVNSGINEIETDLNSGLHLLYFKGDLQSVTMKLIIE